MNPALPCPTPRPISEELGVLFAPGFLDAATCAVIREEIRSSRVWKQGTILQGLEPVVDEATRKARHVKVEEPTRALVRRRLEELGPALAERFARPLRDRQDPQFIAYRPGDFFVFHRDVNGTIGEPDHVRARRLSLVLFLNDCSDAPGPDRFGGGALRFYAPDLLGERAARDEAVSVRPVAGLLLAFDPRVRHQVRPVTHGERFSVVTWFV